MSRPLLPSAILAALAFTAQVRPQYLDDWPQLTDASLISRAGEIVARPSNACACDSGRCAQA